MSTPLIELKSVTKGYGPDGRTRPVLKDINLRIDEGEFVSIVGYSGAGKTTLISLVAGLIEPDEGEVLFRGRPVRGPDPDRALVFQNYSLLPWLSVTGNIRLAVDSVFSSWPAEKRREQCRRFIEMVGLGHARDRRPKELSGGMRQRVSLARALAMDPGVLLLDEPLGALDALTRATLQDEISRIWKESRKTVVLITNDPDEGIYLADRIIPLSAGPGATLGPSIQVDIPRPRDRVGLNHDAHFKTVRRQVIEFLLGSGGRSRNTALRRLVLPEVEPEDLTVRSRFWWPEREARRRSEEHEEKVEV